MFGLFLGFLLVGGLPLEQLKHSRSMPRGEETMSVIAWLFLCNEKKIGRLATSEECICWLIDMVLITIIRIIEYYH